MESLCDAQSNMRARLMGTMSTQSQARCAPETNYMRASAGNPRARGERIAFKRAHEPNESRAPCGRFEGIYRLNN